MKTYIATKDFAVEQTVITSGTIIGTGDAGKGDFKPSKGLELIEIGHVLARLGWTISEGDKPEPAKPEPEPDKAESPAPVEKKRGRKKKTPNPEG